MKYNLPKNLKTYSFFCEETGEFVRYSRCKNLCPATYRKCWENALCADLELDCLVENEKRAEGYIACPDCGTGNIIGLAFNRFMCLDCGKVSLFDAADYKELMGEDYAEIDSARLAEMFRLIK